MLYDSYYKKISKIAGFGQKVFKHIVLISIVIGVILATFITFMATKGIVFDDKSQPEIIKIKYGEAISVDSSALFADTSYEYSTDDGSTWSTTAPQLPGEYQLRVVSKGFFGQNRYGKVYSFVIEPKSIDVNIVEKEIPYGQLLTVSADLPYGDVITCNNFIYEDFSKKETMVKPDLKAVKILNDEGDDVTSAYKLVSKSSSVKLNPIDITIVVEDKGTIYNGVKLTYDGYELVRGELAFEDDIKPVFDKYQLDVGETENTPILNILNKDNLDVTQHYIIHTEIGKLSVDYRPIVIESQSGKNTYDGNPFEYFEYNIAEGTVADGQEIKCVSGSSITNVGSTDNILSFEITDADGNNVNSNYSIIYAWGTIEVTPRPITITTPSSQKVYDGKELVGGEYSISKGSLADGHIIECVESASITNVGEITNELSVVIKNADGVDETENYEISYDFGTLKITPYELKVSSESGSWIYDGNYHSAKINYSGLCEGHEILLSEQKSVIDVSSVENDIEVLAIYDLDGNDVISNYTVTYGEFGTLEVKKRQVSLIMESAEFTYDGIEREFLNYEISSELGMVQDEILTIKVNKFSLASDKVYENELLEYSIYSNTREQDVTSNYELTSTNGKIKINKCILVFEFLDKSKIYDAKPLTLTEDDYKLTAQKLPENHTLDLKFIGSQIEAGVYDGATLDIKNTKVMFGDVDATANFDISANEVTLEIFKREITITTESAETIYSGKAFIHEKYTVSKGSVVDGQTIKATFNASITNVGEVTNEASVIILDADGNDKTSNYDISYEFGTLKVNKFKFSIIFEEKSKVYDGTVLELTDKDVVTDPAEFPTDHVIVINPIGSQTEIGIYRGATIDCANTKIMFGEIDATENFEFSANSVNLIVLPPKNTKLTMKPHDIVVTYDGTTYRPNSLVDEDGFLATLIDIGYIFEFDYVGEQTSAGQTPTYIDNLKITYKDEDVTDYFDIEYPKGSITINKVKLDFVFKDKIKEYDTMPLHLTSNECQNVFDLLPKDHFIEVEFIGSQTEVGVYNDATVRVISITYKGADAISNFEITANKVSLTVVPRQITIVTNSNEKTYDGTVFADSGYQIQFGTLPEGHVLEQTTYASITNAGEIDNVQTFIIKDLANNDQTSNYKISYVFGKLKVNKFSINISFEDKYKIYDGTTLELNYDDCTITPTTLPDGHSLEFGFVGSQTEIGIYRGASIDFNNTTVMFGEIDATANFDISASSVSLSVLPPENTKLIIRPKDVVVTYDGTTYRPTALVDEDGFLATLMDIGYIFEFNYVGEQTDAGYTTTHIDAFKITYKDEDVTDYFDIEFFEGSITVNKVKLNFVFEDKFKEYDGESLTLTHDDCSTVLALIPNGHTIELEFIGSQTEIGVFENAKVDVENTKIIYNGADVTKNFEITTNEVDLNVIPRQITIITSSAEKTYDGKELVDIGYEIVAGTFLEGHTIEQTSFVSIINAGEINNEQTFIIVDSNGVDQSQYYDIYCSPGKLKVNKFKIDISFEDKSKVYDGTVLELIAEDCIITPTTLPDGHILEIGFIGSQIDIGIYKGATIDLNNTTVMFGEINATENFDISVSSVNLVVLPPENTKITIKPEDVIATYDGTAHRPLALADEDGFLATLMDIGYIFEFDYVGEQISAGKTTSYIDNLKITYNNEDVTDYFDIEFLNGSITVDKVKLDFVFVDKFKEYDGESLNLTPEDCSSIFTLIPNDHIIEFEFIGSQTDIGVYEGAKLDIENTKIIYNGVDVTENFEITSNEVALNVIPRQITIITSSDEKTYDGKELVNFDYSVVAGTFLDGHIIEQTSFTSIINAGQIDNKQTFIIKDANGVDQSQYYEIYCVYGKLTVNKFRIDVVLNDKIDVYDDNNFALELTIDDVVSITPIVLPIDHILDLKFKGVQTEVGVYYDATVDLDNTTITFNSENVIENFDIVANKVNLYVYPQEGTIITLKPESKEFTYDGKPHYADSLVDDDGFLATLEELGYSIIIDRYDGEAIDKGLTVTSIDPKNVHIMLNGEDVTDYFELECKISGIVIKQLKLELVLSEKSKEYDGTPLVLTEDDCTIGSLRFPEDHIIVFEENAFVGSQLEIGVYEGATLDLENIKIMVGEKDATENFIISVNEVDLTVLPAEGTKLVLQPEDVYCEFDGEYHKADTLFDIDGLLATLESLGYSIEVDFVGEHRDAGTYYDSFAENPRVMYNGEDVTEYFSYEFLNGTVNIAQCELGEIVLPESITKEYDGEPLKLTIDDCSGISLLDKYTIEMEFSGSQTDVGSSEASVVKDSIKIFLNGEDVTSNFNIVYPTDSCMLIVEARKIVVTTESDSKVYDGTPLTNSNYSIFDSEGNDATKLYELFGIEINVNVIGTITEWGSTVNAAEVSANGTVLDILSDGVALGNFYIEYDFGTLEVVKRRITVTTESDSKIYDGKELTNSNYSLLDNEGNDADKLYELFGIEVAVNVTGTITNFGTAENTAELSIIGDTFNLDNLEIEYDFGVLQITKRKITVTTESASKVYDGTALTNTNYTLVDSEGNDETKLYELFGINIDVNVTGTITDPGTTANTVEISILDADLNSLEIEYEIGNLTVLPAGVKPLKVMVSSVTKTYDGKSLEKELYFMITDDTFDTNRYELSYIKVVMSGAAEVLMSSDVSIFGGQKIDYLKFQVWDKETNTDVTDKYYLELVSPYPDKEDYLIAEIQKKDIYLATGSTSLSYSEGKVLTNSSVVSRLDDLAEGDELIISDTRKLTELSEVGSVRNELLLSDVIIKNSNGDNVTENYNIIIEEGILEFIA